MKHRALAILLVAATVGCASVPLKQQISTSHQTVRQAIVALDDAERQLCGPAPSAPNHCTTTAAATVGLTDAKHQAFSRVMATAYDYDVRAGAAIVAWRAGDPVPADVRALLTYAQQTLAEATALGYGPLVDRASALVARAQTLVDAFSN